jgi:DNA-binding response OmpR family regulator
VKKRILLIEDEPSLSAMLADRLEMEGFETEIRNDGNTGLAAALEQRCDLIVLDVMLPGRNGFDICRTVRQRGVRTPILMLTARGDVDDRITGLRIGADDYLSKPFSVGELLARLDALFRRVAPQAPSVHFGSIHVDRARRQLTRDGALVELAHKEYEMLCYLLERPDVPVSREELLHQVWGYGVTPTTRTVDVHMAQLRQKLEANPKEPRYLLTAHGFGYKFVPDATTP